MVLCGGNKNEVVEFDYPNEKLEKKQQVSGGWRSFFGKGTPNYGSGEKYRRRGWKEIIPGEKTANPGPDGNAPVAIKPAAQETDNAVKGDAAPVSLAKKVKNRVVRGFQRLFSRGRQGPATPVPANDDKIGPIGDDTNAFRFDSSGREKSVQPSKEEPNIFDGTGSLVAAGAKISFSSIKISPKPSLEAKSGHAEVVTEAKSRFPEPILVASRPCPVPDMKIESRKIKVRGNNMEVTVRCIMVKEAPGCTDLLARHGQVPTKTNPEATVPPPATPITKDGKSELVVEDIENFDNENL